MRRNPFDFGIGQIVRFGIRSAPQPSTAAETRKQTPAARKCLSSQVVVVPGTLPSAIALACSSSPPCEHQYCEASLFMTPAGPKGRQTIMVRSQQTI